MNLHYIFMESTKITPQKRLRSASASEEDDPTLDPPQSRAPWPRFLLMRSVDESCAIDRLNPFAITKNISSVIGKDNKISRLRSGDLLIEVYRRTQSENLLQVEGLNYSGKTFAVKVEPHRSLNSCRGVARSPEFKTFQSEAEIVKYLSSQGVVACKRLTIKRDGKLIETGTVFLTFNSSRLPERLTVGFISVKVEEYVPSPLRCFRCQKFGHTSSTCKRKIACAKCAGEHEDKECMQTTRKCVNCSGSHPVFSRDCPVWTREKEIQMVKTQQKVTYREAKAAVEARYPGGESFAKTVASSAPRKTNKTVTIGVQTIVSIPPQITLSNEEIVKKCIKTPVSVKAPSMGSSTETTIPVSPRPARSGPPNETLLSDEEMPSSPPSYKPDNTPDRTTRDDPSEETPKSEEKTPASPPSNKKQKKKNKEKNKKPNDSSSLHPTRKPSLDRSRFPKGSDDPVTIFNREGSQSEEEMEEDCFNNRRGERARSPIKAP